MQISSFMEKPLDDIQTAVADRSRQVFEMDYGALDEEIGQELTEGGAFCDVAPAVFFFDRARWMQIPSFMEKPPNDIQTAVADRSRRVLEMDFGA
jgi:hypothetical protein